MGEYSCFSDWGRWGLGGGKGFRMEAVLVVVVVGGEVYCGS